MTAVVELDELIETGFRLLETDGLRSAQEAMGLFASAIEHDGSRLDAFLGRALAKVALFQYDKALCDIEYCLKSAPDELGFRLVYILVLLDLGLSSEAADQLEAVEDEALLEESEIYANFLMLRARTALAEEDPESASQDIELALRLDGGAGYYHFVKGQTRQAAGDPIGALEALTRALERDPKDPEYLVARGNLLIALSRNDQAASDLRMAVKILSEAGLETALRRDAERQLATIRPSC